MYALGYREIADQVVERSEASRKEAEEEYVYDLYYRDLRDASLALSARADGMSATSIGAL